MWHDVIAGNGSPDLGDRGEHHTDSRRGITATTATTAHRATLQPLTAGLAWNGRSPGSNDPGPVIDDVREGGVEP